MLTITSILFYHSIRSWFLRRYDEIRQKYSNITIIVWFISTFSTGSKHGRRVFNVRLYVYNGIISIRNTCVWHFAGRRHWQEAEIVRVAVVVVARIEQWLSYAFMQWSFSSRIEFPWRWRISGIQTTWRRDVSVDQSLAFVNVTGLAAQTWRVFLECLVLSRSQFARLYCDIKRIVIRWKSVRRLVQNTIFGIFFVAACIFLIYVATRSCSNKSSLNNRKKKQE